MSTEKFDELYKILTEVLTLDPENRFVSPDGLIFRDAVSTAAMQLDPPLLKILLSNQTIRQKFFVSVDGITVFDKINFSWFIKNRPLLPDSYTRFKNKIGLVDDAENFISESRNIVIAFPYKDCVLQGGQTKDEQKRSEIFFNATLARQDIDRLLEPKVFSHAKKFSSAGVEPVTNFSDSDNLIIKGNNLLAAASLLKRFENKIKCIYIDVPYNTGNDSFGYNDRFNHSTWLTFMKNRLELAKKLLRNDGSIWISIDDDEQAYLKILCDEIFDRDNFVCNVIWEKKYTISNDTKYLSDNHDFILVYAKDKRNWRPNFLPRNDKMNKAYKNPDNDPHGVWKPTPLHARSGTATSAQFEYIFKNGVKFTPPKGRYSRYSAETLRKLDESNEIWFGKDGKSTPQKKTFLSELLKGGVPSNTLWRFDEVGHTHEAREELKALISENTFGTPKPERLIQRILTLATNEGDIVLDNFLGSGTTAAVAHKMKRQYIGVEQMDYIETVTVERLKCVIDGEQGGISKAVNWQGGGEFIYCELAKQNQRYVEEIETARDVETLKSLYEKISHSDYISYKVTTKALDAAAKDFEELSIENQKKFLMELLDKNLLYVNYCDMDDEDFGISDADKKFTRSFYGEC